MNQEECNSVDPSSCSVHGQEEIEMTDSVGPGAKVEGIAMTEEEFLKAAGEDLPTLIGDSQICLALVTESGADPKFCIDELADSGLSEALNRIAASLRS